MIELPKETLLAMAVNAVADEVARAMKMHPPQTSAHESFAIIKEELDEFWNEVKKKREDRSDLAMSDELTQVAAMAIRAMVDLRLVKV